MLAFREILALTNGNLPSNFPVLQRSIGVFRRRIEISGRTLPFSGGKWRSLAGNEVDFVLYGGKTFTAIEVKNTKTMRPIDYNGLVSFADDYPEASLLLLYTGNVVMKHKNVLVLPVETFLQHPGDYLK